MKHLFKVCKFLNLSIFYISLCSAFCQVAFARITVEDISIESPKFVIGDNQKHQALIKNVIINRFEEIFERPLSSASEQKIIVEFFDYTCGHCKNMSHILKTIQATQPNVNIIYKEFPIRGELAREAARAAIASKAQDAYDQYHQLLISHKINSKDALVKKAELLDLDITKLKKDMGSKQTFAEISANYGLAKALKVTGTPTFLILGVDQNKQPHVYYFAGVIEQEELLSYLF